MLFRSETLIVLLALLTSALSPSQTFAQAPATESGQPYENALLRFNDGDYQAAIIELKKALRQNPANLAARVLIGRAYLALNDAASAEAALRLARQAGADDHLVLPALAEAYRLQSKYREILDHIPNTGRDPETAAEILTVRGEAYLALSRWDEAEQAFEQAGRLQPQAGRPLLGRVRVLLQRGELDAAGNLADLAAERAPQDPAVWQLRGEIERLQQDLPGALAHYDKAIELKPDFIEARLSRAAVLLDQNQDRAAVADIAYIRTIAPRQPQAAYLHALVLARAGDKAKAQEVLRDAEQLMSGLKPGVVVDESTLDLISGVLNFTLGYFDKARPALSRFLERNPRHAGARRLLAMLLLQQGEPAAAIALLEPAVEQTPDNPQLLALLGQAYLGIEQPARAMPLLEKAVELAPDQAGPYTQRALGRLATGRVVEAVEDLKQALARDAGAVQAGSLLSRIYLEQKDYDAALALARSLTRHAPDNAIAHDLAGAAQLGKGDVAAALASFARALAVDPAYLPARLNLASAELQAGDSDKARALYQEVLDRHPREIRAMLGLAALAEREQRLDEAIRWREKVRDFDPGAVASHLHLIELYRQIRQPATALAVAQQLRVQHPKSLSILEAVGRTELALGDVKEAAATFRQLAVLAADAPQQLYHVAQLQIQAADLQSAAASLSRVILTDPNFPPARAALVEVKIRQGELAEALRLAEQLRDSHPQAAAGDSLAGDVLMRLERFAEAAAAYARGWRKEPTTPLLLLRLYQAHWRAGDRDRAVQVLAEGLKGHPQDSAIAGALATAYLAAGRPQQAKAHYEALLQQHSDNASLLNNLAWIYQQLGDPRALSYAERAYRLEPDNTAVLDTLGWILVQQGEPARGLHWLRDAQARSAKDPQIRYHLAVALSRLGRAEEARQHLQEALKTNPAFAGAAEAQALLKQLAGR